jgi:hypothetical protein
VSGSGEERFLGIVLADPTVRAVLVRAPELAGRPPAGARRERASGGGQGVLALFALVVRPNRSQAPRHVYEAKAQRWREHWPELTVLPWEG